MNNVVLVMFSDYDLATLATLTHTMFGQSICREADKKELPEKLHNLECLKNFGENQNINKIYFVSFLILADSRDILDLLTICNGLSFIYSPTRNRDCETLIVTGSLCAWDQVLVNAFSVVRRYEIENIFKTIYKEVEKLGIYSFKIPKPISTVSAIEYIQ